MTTTAEPSSSVADASERGQAPPAPGLVDRLADLAQRVTTPLLPSDYLELFAPLRSSRNLRGRILAIEAEAGDSATIVIRPGRGWRGHVPGQYLRIGVDIDGVRLWRCYSITSAPDRPDRTVRITVRAVTDGLVSSFLTERARAGLIVQLDQAQGEFVLPAKVPAKLLLLTAGSGLTPVLGILAGSAAKLADVVIVHSERQPSTVLLAGELRELARRHGFCLIERYTAEQGRLDLAAELSSLVPDWAERHTWLCGPSGLIEAAEAHWSAAGVMDRLHVERFRPTLLEAASDTGTVSFSKSDVRVEISGGTPILEAAEASGVLMPSGCRMGVCYSCVLPLTSGVVRDLRDGAVTTASPGDGVRIQTCISTAAGPCEIDH
jgi:ferredoxin-NADP reductase